MVDCPITPEFMDHTDQVFMCAQQIMLHSDDGTDPHEIGAGFGFTVDEVHTIIQAMSAMTALMDDPYMSLFTYQMATFGGQDGN